MPIIFREITWGQGGALLSWIRVHAPLTDTFSLTNANTGSESAADELLHADVQGWSIRQSPQEVPTGAVYVPVHMAAAPVAHNLPSAQVRDDLAGPADRHQGIEGWSD